MRWLARLVPRDVLRDELIAALREEVATCRQMVIVQRKAIRNLGETVARQRKAIDDLTTSLARSEARREAAERQLREVDGG